MRAGIDGMKSRWLFVIGVCCCLLPASGIAGVGDWKNYTTMRSVRSVASDGQSLWAATSGGVFRFDPADSTYQKFLKADGLSTNDATAIFIDASGRVWIGHQSGNIDLYDPAAKRWRNITDIAVSGKTNSAINAFYQNGDDLYIATAFGVTVFSVSRFEFSDTYTNFSTGISQPNVAAVRVFQNRVFLATSAGIVSSNAGAVNLADPASWTPAAQFVSTANAFAVLNGSLYTSTGSGLWKFQSSNWSVTNGLTAAVRIVVSSDTALVFTEGTSLKSLNTANNVSVLSSSLPSTVNSGTQTSDKKIYLGFPSFGIGSMNALAQWQTYAPNGPNSNSFYQIVVDERGYLWSASGSSGGGSGFYRFDGQAWRNFTTANTPLLLTNDCFAIGVGPNNSKWVGTWGEGLMLVDANERVVRRFDYSYPGFIGVVRDANIGTPSYTVPGKIAVDRSGAVWVTVYASINNAKVVWKMNRDSSWESFSGSPNGAPSSFMRHVVVDQNNTKWFVSSIVGSNPPENITSVFFNENNTVRTTVNGWGMLTSGDGLTDEHIYSVVNDLSGDIWLGTGKGITIVQNPLNPPDRLTKVFNQSVRDQAIQCMAIDALDNKWVGTNTGVYVLSPDGTQLLNQYSVENTNRQLVDNNIISIAFDHTRGMVYFGTEKGLSSLEIAAVTPKNTFATIELSPNPVYLPNHSSVEIRGLVDDCSIKVLALNGKVIKQFPAQGGGRAFWDCRDTEGREVGSGIYIIVAYNTAGDQVSSSKIAVIRK